MEKYLIKCTVCFAENPFRKTVQGYVCTNCGTMNNKIGNYMDNCTYQQYRNHEQVIQDRRAQTTKYNNYVEKSETRINRTGDPKEINENIKNKKNNFVRQQRMVDNFFRNDIRKRDLLSLVTRYYGSIYPKEDCNSFEQLSRPSNKIIIKIHSMVNKYDQIIKIRGLEGSAVALIVIARRNCAMPVDVKTIETIVSKKNINKRIKILCKIMKIGTKLKKESEIPRISQLLELTMKESKKVQRLYNIIREANKTIGEQTVLLVALFHIYKKLDRNKEKNEDELIVEMSDRIKINRYSMRTHIKKNWEYDKIEKYIVDNNQAKLKANP